MQIRILIADDNPQIRETIRKLFQPQDSFVICGEAVNGKDAIEKAEQLNPDLIILDLSMPVMNGLDAARILKRTKPVIPLILFTLHGSSVLQSEADAIGISKVISKTDIGDLVRQILAIFNRSTRSQPSSRGN